MITVNESLCEHLACQILVGCTVNKSVNFYIIFEIFNNPMKAVKKRKSLWKPALNIYIIYSD